MSEAGQHDKSFVISKQLVWEAYEKVKANKGAPGVDGQSLAVFESDLKGNLYKIWNRMSSGTYFPPPVKAVVIPKPHGGSRTLGVPTVADRIAQTVVALTLEPRTESIFHDDSFGYRPKRSALQAVERCRQRCFRRDWVLDLDVAQFFDSAISAGARGTPESSGPYSVNCQLVVGSRSSRVEISGVVVAVRSRS